MASVASHLIQEVTAHAQSDSLEDAREMCADDTYFPNNLRISFQFLTFRFFRSPITSSCHCCLGLPAGLVPIGFQSSSFLGGLAWSILWTCPSHLILCALMNLTISAPPLSLSISMLFRDLHVLSILIGPNTSLVFAFKKCVCCIHLLLLMSKSLMSNWYMVTQLVQKYNRCRFRLILGFQPLRYRCT